MQDDLASLQRDLDLVRDERDNVLLKIQRAAAVQRQAEAVKLGGFIRSLPPLLSIATRLRGLQATLVAFANAVRSAVPASFELLPPSPPQFLALVPVILAAAVLTSPQAPDLEALASVLKQAVVGPAAPIEAPSISFAVPAHSGTTSPIGPRRLVVPGGRPGTSSSAYGCWETSSWPLT